MDYINALLMGALQGFTEFLPISSSGHLALFQYFFGGDAQRTDLFLEVLLHLGTLIAVVIAFFPDVKELFLEFFRLIRDIFTRRFDRRSMSPHRRMLIMIVVASLPLVLALLMKDWVAALSGSAIAVGALLMVNGLMLFLSDSLASGRKGMGDVRPRGALTVGLFQVVGTLPGISRSGSTITGGLFAGFSREFAVKFSFIMSIPAILGANLLEGVDAVRAGVDSALIGPYALGIAVAMVTGLAAIKLIQVIIKKRAFRWFGLYSICVGAASIIGALVKGA